MPQTQAGFESIPTGILGVDGNHSRKFCSRVAGTEEQNWRELEPEGAFQITQLIHLVKKRQSYMMTASLTLTVNSGWRALCILFSGE